MKRINFFVVALVLCLSCPLFASSLDAKDVIAIVGEKEIVYGDVKASEGFNEIFSPEQIMRNERHRLRGIIRNIIFEEAVQKYNLSASESEITKRVDANFAKANFTSEQVQKICEKSKAVYQALVEYQKDRSLAQEIYQKRLSSLMTEYEWKVWMSNDTPESLEKIVVCNNLDDMKNNSRGSAKKDILHEKLRNIITKNVKVSQQEVEQEYQRLYKETKVAPKYEEVKDEIYLKLLKIKKGKAVSDWYKMQYEEKGVHITNDTFKDLF